jgi:hypothetical protein
VSETRFLRSVAALSWCEFEMASSSLPARGRAPLAGHCSWRTVDGTIPIRCHVVLPAPHDGPADPIFIYANRTAQSCFGYACDTFTRLPSRLSAEAPGRAERQRLLQTVARDGFIDNYHGIRIAGSGRRFWIEHAVVWELLDNAGTRHGQAAIFRDWRPID